MITNPYKEPLDIIILAGQSNAQGYGLGETSTPYIPSESIISLVDEVIPTYVKDENGKDKFIMDESSDYRIEISNEETVNGGKCACFALPFANEYKNEFLDNGKKLLIIKAAVGGTGFAHNQWGVGQCLYNRMIKMTDAALAMNKENRVVAFLWHQGECDAFERPELSPSERKELHYSNLTAFLKAVREKYGNIPFLAGGFVKEWSDKFKTETDAVTSAIKNVCEQNSPAAFISSDGLKSNNETTGNGDDIHFCRDSVYILGKRYYNTYKTLRG